MSSLVAFVKSQGEKLCCKVPSCTTYYSGKQAFNNRKRTVEIDDCFYLVECLIGYPFHILSPFLMVQVCSIWLIFLTCQVGG